MTEGDRPSIEGASNAQPMPEPRQAGGISGPHAAGKGLVSSTEPLYFLTNQMNLLSILSSRLIGPRESFQKYYTDLLQETPGWVPLLRAAPPPELIKMVTAEPGAGGAVLIEFPLSALGGEVSDLAVVYVPAIALSKAVAIHLSSERRLREHRARNYINIHPHDQLLRVTPELFGAGVFDQALGRPPGPALAIDWHRIDRVRGTLSAVFASIDSEEQLELTAALVGVPHLPATVSAPQWLRWSELDDHSSPATRPNPELTQADHAVFRAVRDVLGNQDLTKSWSPNEVLDEVETRVHQVGLVEEAAQQAFLNLARVRSIINVEADFEPFRQSAHGLVSAMALLLVLLRERLDHLLAWPHEETGANVLTRLVAAAYAGRLRGLARESIKLRSLALDDFTAAWAVRVAHGRPSSLGQAELVRNSHGTTLRIGRITLTAHGLINAAMDAPTRGPLET